MNAFSGPRFGAFLRRGGANTVLCVAVALLLATMPGRRLDTALLHTLAIGSLCWLAIDGGRLLLSRLLARRDPDGTAAREGWPGWGWMALLIVLGVAVAFPAGTWIANTLGGRPDAGFTLRGQQTAFLLLLTLAASVVATGYFVARGRLASAAARTEAARRSAAEAQLKLLEAQLEPHMLFNTLANLRVLIGSDPPRAQAMLDRLIAFLRSTLAASRCRLHPLANEFERIDDYLALMSMRMGARLTVELRLPEDLRAHPVPPLLLQPLVENAVRHGVEPCVDGGTIAVSARHEHGRLLLEVRDTGAGLDAVPRRAAGGTRFGLTQVRERLAAMYGDAARLTLAAGDDPRGGASARIELPWDPTSPPR